jgi:hypothetical protein
MEVRSNKDAVEPALEWGSGDITPWSADCNALALAIDRRMQDMACDVGVVLIIETASALTDRPARYATSLAPEMKSSSAPVLYR